MHSNDRVYTRPVTQAVLEVILAGTPDGSHGDPGGGGSSSPVTTAYGYAT